MVPSLSSLILLSVLPLTALSSVVQRQTTTTTDQFDYVVVGGGAGGAVIANRLTENRSVSVLLIEAGPDNEGRLEGQVPYIYQRLFGSNWDWNYTTTPQPGLNNRVSPYFRGHVLGGSTSINGMTYTRGPASNWNRIANYIGDQSWSWNNLQSYFRKNEAFIPPTGSGTGNRFDPAVHGTSGPIGVSLNSVNQWIIDPTLTAAEQTGIFPYNRDGNSGSPLGISWQQFAIRNGARSSAATGYLNQQVRARSNLRISLSSRATRLIAQNGTSPLRFTTVEYQNAAGATVRAVARREIIVSAGVIDTPVLLMRSGLGDAAELTAAGITPLVNISAIGKNFIDHVGTPAAWSVNTTLTDDEIDRNSTLFNQLLAEWNQSKTGRLTTTSLSHIEFSRLPNNASIFQTVTDPTGGAADTPHYEQILANKWTMLSPRPASGNWVGMTHFVLSPVSTGTVKLNPANAQGPPLLDSGSLSHPFDIFVLRSAIRSTAAYMNAPAWRQFNAAPAFDASILNNDAALDNFIRSNSFAGAHGVATAKMGPRNSPAGSDVVGPDFRVKGVQGLRIVDASVIPFSPSGHSMVPTYVFAEKAADIIKSGN
ncbi:hypothetical protein EST38_g6809 [Candolleomyces aberdarensis]|uniref:pyranose dehydrogenase (acceptor) n=1 Tax=Candolleomyces aberdarensis TaxID=2316362 RepID=A0A4Q2DGQ1_9AGAR|nr:hypothetical protein EST38_g6809 [Candolleomyces aberdarensis]